MNDADRDPEDLAAIQHTDRVLDEIARGGNPVGNEEPIPTLVGWRREMDAVPGPELVDPATAAEAIRAGRMPWWYRVMFRIFRWMRGGLVSAAQEQDAAPLRSTCLDCGQHWSRHCRGCNACIEPGRAIRNHYPDCLSLRRNDTKP